MAKLLSSHPPPGALFADWFKEFSRIISQISPADVLSDGFKAAATPIASLKNEVIYELSSSINREESSVYDRSDYVVRELLRTSRLPTILSFCKQTAEHLRTGKLTLQSNGTLLKDGALVDPFITMMLLVEIPSVLALCFTAVETVGVVSLADLISFAHDVLELGKSNLTIALDLMRSQHTIFSAALFALTSCVNHMKVLNTTLFFTLFQEQKLFEKIVGIVICANKQEANVESEKAIEFLNAYIKVAQSESDRKQCAQDPKFVELYQTMMKEVVEPNMKSNRSKFRSILFYSRSLNK